VLRKFAGKYTSFKRRLDMKLTNSDFNIPVEKLAPGDTFKWYNSCLMVLDVRGLQSMPDPRYVYAADIESGKALKIWHTSQVYRINAECKVMQ
jgi:hypothetical protein